MKHKILTSILGISTIAAAVLSWGMEYRAILVPDASVWALPMVAFSFFALCIALDIVLIKETMLIELILLLSLLTSFIFVHSLQHLLGIFFGATFLFISMHGIRRDIDQNTKVSLWKSLQVGRVSLVFGLALAITSQYYLTIQTMEGEKVVPRLDVSPVADRLLIPVLGAIYPQIKDARAEITVDEFILQTQEEDQGSEEERFDQIVEQEYAKLPPAQRDAVRQQQRQEIQAAKAELMQRRDAYVLEEGRKQFSAMVGASIEGNEKLSDVFSGMINKKLNDYFRPTVGAEQQRSPYPVILSIILLLTVYPIGSVLSGVWFVLVVGVFKLLLKAQVVSLSTITVEKQVIE